MLKRQEPEDVFSWGTKWWRCRYQIKTQDCGNGRPISLIVACPDTPPDFYDVFEQVQSSRPAKQPAKPNAPELSFAPHTALARLDLRNEHEILGFVNKWGLLGLWQNEAYRHRTPFLAPPKPGPTGLCGQTEEYSGWYKNEASLNQEGQHLHSFQEPLDLFIEAAGAYQRLCQHLAEADNIQDKDEVDSIKNAVKTEAEWKFSGMLHGRAHPRPVFDRNTRSWRFGWECHSLLAWIYLLTFLECVNGLGFKRCSGCHRIFSPANPRAKVCSRNCGNNKRVKDHRARRKEVKQNAKTQ